MRYLEKNCEKKVKMTSGNVNIHLDRACPKGPFSASSPKTVEKIKVAEEKKMRSKFVK